MDTLTPRPGHVVEVSSLPSCDFCGATGTWDIPTIHGPWANACDACEPLHHTAPGATGVGVGQRLVLPREQFPAGTVGRMLGLDPEEAA